MRVPGIFNKLAALVKKGDAPPLHMEPLVSHEETRPIHDAWINAQASIGANNSLTQYNQFMMRRLDYRQCALISLDTLINKSIIALSYDIITHGYNITLECADKAKSVEIKDRLENRIRDYDLDRKWQDLATTALRFGGGLLYFDIDSRRDLPITNDFECAAARPLNDFVIVEPSNVSAGVVNTSNPLLKDYMRPAKWFVTGCGMVDSSRLAPLVFFDTPAIIKPLFNYLGISLTQLMQDYTQNADTIRQALTDLLLRFKTDYIKTSSENIANEEYLARIKYNNATKNNLSTLLLSENEELQTLSTSVAGLDNIASQAYELVVASSGVPATRLMGISPSGFNATGESDLIHYYELIAQYQSKVKPVMLECLRKILAYDLKIFDIVYLDLEFNPVGYRTEKEKLEAHNLKADYFVKLAQGGLISELEALEALQNEDFLLYNVDLDSREAVDNPLESITEGLFNE